MKKVTVTVTRNYTKQTSVEIEVDDNLSDEKLQNFLTNNSELDEQIEEGLGNASLNYDTESWRYDTDDEGGNL
jgi:hypothetical protein